MAADKMPLEGDNSYGFKRGIGKDYFGGAPGITTIRFDGDLTLSDFKIRLEGGDLVFYLIDPANPNHPLNEISDVFYFDNWIANDHGIERFKFADGTTLSKIAVQSDGRLKFYGTNDDDSFIGTSGRDEIYGSEGADTIDGNGGTDIINYLLSDAGVTVNLAIGEGSGGHAEGDRISNVESIIGSYHDDVLIGDDGNNNLFAQNGNDHLEGGAGDDWLNAYGSGADYVDGGSGNDTVRYRWSRSGVTVDLTDQSNNSGDATGDVYVSIENVMGSNSYDDHITGDAGDNKIWGYGGNDTLEGGDGNDSLLGGNGNDILKAGNGDDYLDGGAGDDEFHYGEGVTTFRYDLGDGDDTIHVNHDVDSSYNDKIIFGPSISPDEITVTRQGEGTDKYGTERDDLDLLLTFKDGGTLLIKEAFFYSPNHLSFGEFQFSDGTVWNWESFNKMRFENAGDEGEELAGTLGDDTIDGRGGDDKIDGYSGDDHLIGGEGNDTLQGHDGDDHLEGGAGDDKLSSSAGNNILDGGDGNDTFFSITYGEDQIIGGSGDDTIYAVTGASVITGGEGYDTINVSSAEVTVHYDFGDGNDVVDFWYPERLKEENHKVILGSGISPDEVTVTRSNGTSSSILLSFKDGGTLSLRSVIDTDTLRLNFGEIEFADGTVWDWEDINEKLLGTSSDKADYLGGTTGDDLIEGHGGDDVINGEAGNDHLIGGAGNDTLSADEGDDHLEGGDGDDRLEAHRGTNILDGGDGDDIITSFSNENNQLLGGAGNDTIHAYGNSSIIEGGTGDDFIAYRSKNATFHYKLGDGNDTLEATSSPVQPNKIILGEGISTDTVIVTREEGQPNDLVLNFADGGTLLIKEAFSRQTSQFNFGEIQFADGTVWNWEDIDQKLTGEAPSTENVTKITLFGADDYYSTASQEDHIILAGAGNDTIITDKGDDQLHGQAGDDTLTGGEGNDAFYFGANFGNDIITDLTAGEGSVDTIHFIEGTVGNFEDVITAASDVGTDTVIQLDEENSVTLRNVSIADLHADDFVFAS